MDTSKRPATAKHRRKAFAPLGGILWLLAIIGLVAVVLWSVNFTQKLLDNSKEVGEFEQFIQPVVMMDPVPFNTIENAQEDFILQSSLWAALLGENRSNFTYDEIGLLLVPASDVDVAAHKLFGPDVTIVHRSFDDVDTSYMYDPEIGAYRVPMVAKVAYSPKVERITRQGNTITLLVGYVAPGNIWSTDINANKQSPEPDKYMNYELVKGESGYYIAAIKDVADDIVPRG